MPASSLIELQTLRTILQFQTVVLPQGLSCWYPNETSYTCHEELLNPLIQVQTIGGLSELPLSNNVALAIPDVRGGVSKIREFIRSVPKRQQSHYTILIENGAKPAERTSNAVKVWRSDIKALGHFGGNVFIQVGEKGMKIIQS